MRFVPQHILRRDTGAQPVKVGLVVAAFQLRFELERRIAAEGEDLPADPLRAVAGLAVGNAAHTVAERLRDRAKNRRPFSAA